MKKSIYIIGICLLGLSMGCQKNDDSASMEITLQQEAPLSFDLLQVPDEATDVDLRPTLSWESAKNPEGGEVTYDLYLGKETNPTTIYESDISETSFKLDERLNLISEHYWKVVAKDVDGQTSKSAINKFTTRNLNFPETPVTGDAAFSTRTGFATAVFNEKIWVIGGRLDGALKNDVWYSEDGVNWIEAHPSAQFSARRKHSLVVFNDRLWLIGGLAAIEEGAHLNDVWSTNDGISWIQETESAAFPRRAGHSTLVYDERIWLLGGSGPSLIKDVWFSEDGINWTEAVNETPFHIGLHHTAMVFDDKLWVLGGATIGIEQTVLHKDIWYSTDGANWTLATDAPAFPARIFESGFVFDDKMWLVGGLSQEGNLLNDVWFSENGTDWKEAINTAPFPKRRNHKLMVFKEIPWVIGGIGPSDEVINDVWMLD